MIKETKARSHLGLRIIFLRKLMEIEASITGGSAELNKLKRHSTNVFHAL